MTQYVYLREASLKLTFWNIATEWDAGTQWWGPVIMVRLMTDHAFPLDMIKLGSAEPFRLPWLLEKLGEWKIDSFLARLEGAQTLRMKKYLAYASVICPYLGWNWG